MEHKFCPYCMNPVEEGKPCGSCGLTQGSYTPSPHHLPPGTVLKDRYLVGRVLGEGGFGITYIGCDLQLELKVAIKEYFPTDKASRLAQVSLEVSSYAGAAGAHYDKGLTKFLQEARTIARMDKQPVIVNVRDFFQVNHTAYIVMEYVEGTTFKELVDQRGGRIPARELLRLMEPLFFALKEMHDNGLIHRDISPDNLMIEKGEVRLLDFGCARESADGGNTLTIALKHGYAPVEQYQSKGQGPWTDVYALSATIYYCLTGKKPPQAMDRLVEDELVPPRKLGVELTQRQEKALLYGMGVAPKRRYQSMEEFHTALYEGFVPGGLGETDDGPKPAVIVDAAADDGPEPAVTGDAETDGGAEPAVTADGLGADSPDAAEKTAETPPAAEKEPFGLAAWLKRNRLLAGGAAAALALVIALLVWHPWTGAPSSADDPPPSGSLPVSQTGQDSTQTQQPAPKSFSEEQTADENGLVLLAMLADDGLDEVTIPKDVSATVHEHVTLTKTLRVEGSEYAWTNFPNGLTVAEGGRLQTWCNMSVSTLLRILDGGTVSVESGGQLNASIIWQDREGSLTAVSDGRVYVWGDQDPTKEPLNDLYSYSHYMILDEEALFANAVQVSDGAQFAANCQGNSPIVINGEVTLNKYCNATVPILIPEGASLYANCDEYYGDCTLDVDCTVLVNHGALMGRVSLMDYSADRMQANPRLVNYGTVKATLNAYAGSASTIVNYGEIEFADSLCGGSELNQAAIANLGRMVTPQGVQVDQSGNHSCNAGTFRVSGGTWNIWGGATLWSGSTITVGEGGRLANHGNLTVEYGALEAFRGAAVENYSVLKVEGSKFILGIDGSNDANAILYNDGIVQHGSDSLDFGWASAVSGDGRMVHFSWNDPWGDRVRHVENERDLRQALVNPAVDLVIWNGFQAYNRIELTGGDLEITKGVYLNAPGGDDGGNGTIRGGNVTVTGENAFLILNNINFGGNSGLRVENGACVLYEGCDPNLGSLTLDSGGLYASTSFATVNGPVTLSGGGRLVNSGDMEVRGGPVTIGEGSAIENYSPIWLVNSTVTNDGRFLAASFFELDGGRLTNHGQASFDFVHLTGTVSNHGEIRFGTGGDLDGQIVNETDGVIVIEGTSPENCPVVRGTLDNRGTIRAAVGGDLNVDGGRVTGNLIIYE